MEIERPRVAKRDRCIPGEVAEPHGAVTVRATVIEPATAILPTSAFARSTPAASPTHLANRLWIDPVSTRQRTSRSSDWSDDRDRKGRPSDVLTAAGKRLEGEPHMPCMLRPGNWTRPAGASPARVIAGEPGSRPRFVTERRRAERGVKSLFGGSKRACRSATRRESCSLVTCTTGEPSRSCHGEGPRPTDWRSGMPWSGPPGVGGAARTHGQVRDRRDPSAQPRQQRPPV